ncbi:unnamed protein product [Sphagnum compactum]
MNMMKSICTSTSNPPINDTQKDDLQPEEMDHGGGGPAASYPERPGEPDCGYYMRTGLCGFGISCRFNHPSNALAAQGGSSRGGEYPERLGQPDCQYFLKTGTCKFGATCKYHHPSDKAGSIGRVQINVLGFPLRLEEKDCAYYMRTGSCKYGVTCKFHHPQPAAMGALVSMSGSSLYATPATQSSSTPQPYPAGLPSWPIAARAPYLQVPSTFAPVIVPPLQGVVSMTGWNTYQGPVNDLPTPEEQQHSLGSRFPYGGLEMDAVSGYAPYIQGSSAMGLPVLQPQPIRVHKETVFPERPGQPECQYYIKTGDCKFGVTCRYHHPKDRTTTAPTCVLNSLGLPLRPGSPPCTFYTRYGICKFGPTCKFDHPLRGLTYGSPASLQTDIPVGGPYPSGSLLTVLTPSSSSEVPQEVSNTASPSDEPTSEEVSGCIPLRAIPDSAVMRTMAASNLLAQGTSSEMAINSPATEILDAS